MEFDDFCIEKSQVVGDLVTSPKDFLCIAKLRMGRSNFMENVQQFVITTEVISGYLFSLNTTSHIFTMRVPDLQQEFDWALMSYHISLNC